MYISLCIPLSLSIYIYVSPPPPPSLFLPSPVMKETPEL